jgi:protein-tyrosine phosphatase
MRLRAAIDSQESHMTQHRILFVCMSNICCSPLAETAMRRLIGEEDRLDHFLLDSAGVSGTHIGERPDPRALLAAKRCGLDASANRARQVGGKDFKQFDLILATDYGSAEALRELAVPGTEHKVHLLLDFSPWIGVQEIPDPYAGVADSFAETLDLIQLAVRGLLETIDQADAAFVVPEMPRARLKVSSAT